MRLPLEGLPVIHVTASTFEDEMRLRAVLAGRPAAIGAAVVEQLATWLYPTSGVATGAA